MLVGSLVCLLASTLNHWQNSRFRSAPCVRLSRLWHSRFRVTGRETGDLLPPYLSTCSSHVKRYKACGLFLVTLCCRSPCWCSGPQVPSGFVPTAGEHPDDCGGKRRRAALLQLRCQGPVYFNWINQSILIGTALNHNQMRLKALCTEKEPTGPPEQARWDSGQEKVHSEKKAGDPEPRGPSSCKFVNIYHAVNFKR